METKIISFSGRRQSGKNTCCNFIFGLCLDNLNIIPQGAKWFINEEGLLAATNIGGHVGEIDDPVIFNPTLDRKEFERFVDEALTFYPEDGEPFPFVNIYSLADDLKDFCVNVLGLKHHQVWGTDKQKDEKTHLMWEQMPGVILPGFSDRWGGGLDFYEHDTGPMTGREVLQYFGTNIVRKIYSKAWIRATINRIKKQKPEFALICDVRFPDEVEGIQQIGGKVIRLTRNQDKEALHNSETRLDKKNFDWAKFDMVLDNANMNIPQQNAALLKILDDWKYIEIGH